jgi:hypothetical protein
VTQSLFGPTPTITFGDEAEAVYGGMSLRVLFDAAGTIPWIRFWGTVNDLTTEPFAAVYEPDGDLRYSQTFGPGGLLLNQAWNQLNLTIPVPVAAGETLDITVGPRDRYAGASGVLPVDNGQHLSASGSFFKTGAALVHPDQASSLWFGIDVGFDALIEGTLQAAASAAVLAGAGRSINRGAVSIGISGLNLAVAGRIVNAGSLQAIAPAAVLSASQVRDQPGSHTASGTAATLTASGTASTLTASGTP